MSRYILRYHGEGAKPHDDVQRFRCLPEVKLIDESSKMLLVDAPSAESLQAVLDTSGRWSISPEESMELPPRHPDLAKPRPRPER
jgi:hypothetical protein